MNSKARGSALELRLKAHLEELNFRVEKARAQYTHGRGGPPRSVVVDFFNCFDLIAKRRGDRTTWIQVTTTNTSVAEKVRKIEPMLRHLTPMYDDVWIARWQRPKNPGDRGVWRIVRWDDAFDVSKTYILSTADIALPWETSDET